MLLEGSADREDDELVMKAGYGTESFAKFRHRSDVRVSSVLQCRKCVQNSMWSCQAGPRSWFAAREDARGTVGLDTLKKCMKARLLLVQREA